MSREPWEIKPGLGWRTARRVTQSLAIIAIFIAPILGGWQRAYRGTMSAWQMRGWDLPSWLANLLPEASSKAVYEANKMVGGGAAVDYFDVPVTDPVASTAALLAGQNHLLVLVAWAIPIVLALLFGRVFCGWFCPFGLLARGVDRVLSLLPFKHRGFELPRRRPIRFVILAIAIIGGALAGEWVMFVFLPHVLAQASVYSLLLLGGIGAVGGAFLGLVGAGLFFGPTLYCAALCPTGAALGLLGTARIARVTVPDPDSCGSCALCHRACWIGLRPKEGDPGPDCDLCTRCFSACPRSKMVIRFSKPRLSGAKKLALVAVCSGLVFGYPSDSAAKDESHHKPELVLNGYRETPEFTVAVSVVDLTDTQFTLDTELAHGIELSAYVVKGSKEALDEDGKRAPDGDIHDGPLTVTVTDAAGEPMETLGFERPNAPMSTPKRTIFRRKLPYQLEPGATVTLEPVPGIYEDPMTWTVPDVHPARNGNFLAYLAAGALTFGGLLSLALAFGTPRKVPGNPLPKGAQECALKEDEESDE